MGLDQAKAATANDLVSNGASANPESWLPAAGHPDLRPFAEEIAAGVAEGEFERCDVEDVADRTLALIDGLGVRALIGDPAMTLERARAVAAAALARDLGVGERLTEPGGDKRTVNLTPRSASQ